MSIRGWKWLSAAMLIAGCNVQSSRPPVTAGEGVLVDGESQTIAVDPAKVPLLPACSAGQVPRRTASGWDCMTPESMDPARVPSVASCQPGQVVQKTADGWTCVARVDSAQTPVVPSCNAGEFVQKTASGWACAPSFDPAQVPQVVSCEAGQVVRLGAAGWECAAAVDSAQTPVVPACGAGLFVQKTASGWTCAPALDPMVTPVVAPCQAGQYVRKTQSGWECASAIDPAQTPVVTSCADGQIVQRSGNGWKCVAAPPDASKTPVVPTCAAGQYVRKTQSGWECTTAFVGDLTGNVTGNVSGTLTGNLTGDVTGNVTGDVSGTAQNVRGIVGIANGGTGVSSLPANALAMMNPAGTALTGLAPAPGMIVAGSGSAWQASAPFDLGLARRTTAALTLYVRTDGSDSVCDGSADAPSSAAPACAVASLQKAFDRVPEIVQHPVIVNVAAGTYHVAANATAVEIAKMVTGAGSILVRGVGGGVLLSGFGSNGSDKEGGRGINVFAPTERLTLQNLIVEGFKDTGIVVQRASVSLVDVIARNNAGIGLLCQQGAQCSFSGTNRFVNNTNGFFGRLGAVVSFSGTVTASNNTGSGFLFDGASNFYSTADVTASNNVYYGLYMASGAVGTLAAAQGSQASFTASGNGSVSVYVRERASLTSVVTTFTASVASTSTFPHVVRAEYGGAIILYNVSATTIGCANAPNSIAIAGVLGASIQTGGAGTITLQNCSSGIFAGYHSYFADDSAGTRTMTNVTSVGTLQVLSAYVKGGFSPIPGGNSNLCGGGAQCQ